MRLRRQESDWPPVPVCWRFYSGGGRRTGRSCWCWPPTRSWKILRPWRRKPDAATLPRLLGAWWLTSAGVEWTADALPPVSGIAEWSGKLSPERWCTTSPGWSAPTWSTCPSSNWIRTAAESSWRWTVSICRKLKKKKKVSNESN